MQVRTLNSNKHASCQTGSTKITFNPNDSLLEWGSHSGYPDFNPDIHLLILSRMQGTIKLLFEYDMQLGKSSIHNTTEDRDTQARKEWFFIFAKRDANMINQCYSRDETTISNPVYHCLEITAQV